MTYIEFQRCEFTRMNVSTASRERRGAGFRRKAQLLLSTALVATLFGAPVFALNECGVDGVGQGVNVCGNATYVSQAGANDIAIEYLNSDGLTLSLTNPVTSITPIGGVPFAGVFLRGTNGLTIDAPNATSISGFVRGAVVIHDGPAGNTNINFDGATITTAASNIFAGYGAYTRVNAGSTADAAITLANSSIALGATLNGSGVLVDNQGLDGDASVALNNTIIETFGGSGWAANSVVSNVTSTGTALLTMNGGSVLTPRGIVGVDYGGVAAQNLGLGDAIVELTDAVINVRGSGVPNTLGVSALYSGRNGAAAVVGNAFPSVQQNPASTATARATMTGGSIFVGNMLYANGLAAVNWSSGGAEAVLIGGTVETDGENANGVLASTQRNLGNTSSVSSTVVGGNVTVNGFNAVAVAAYSAGTGTATADVGNGSIISAIGTQSSAIGTRSHGATVVRVTGPGTTVTANGADSSGIWSRQLTAGATSTFDVFVGDGVSVTGGTGTDSAGIEIESQAGNTGLIQVANGAVVDGSSGLAGIWDKDGDATVTVAGNVLNGIRTEAGADTVNLIGGSVTTGGVDTGADDDIVNVSSATAGSFATLTGGIFTDSGEDVVYLGQGSVVAGGLNTGADDDIFEIVGTAGFVASLTGGINAGTGDDTGALRSGSVVAGDILMNDGSDELWIDGDADIVGATAIDGGDDTSPADGFVDILHLNGGVRSFAGGDLTNWETVDLTGGADITFSGSALVTGSAAGVSSFGEPYGLVVQSGAFARFDGPFVVDGNLNNAGTVDLSLDGTIGTVLDVQSDYVGTAGSALLIDVFLEDGGLDNVPTNDLPISDQIRVSGNGSGTTDVFVTNIGGPGNYTDLNSNGTVDNNEGILFAQVEGSSTAGLFTLGGPVTVGAFTYDLVAFDPGTSQSGFWDYVLANRFSNPSQSYEVYPRAVMFTMPTLHQRVGNRHWTGVRQPEVAAIEIFCKDPEQDYRCVITEEQAAYYDDGKVIEESGAWVRVVGSQANIIPTFSTTGATYDVETLEVQAGIDRLLRENDNGNKWIGGINAQLSQSRVAGEDVNGDASMQATGLGLGATLTYYRPNGFYTDLQARVMGVGTDFSSVSSGSYDDAESVVLSASVEIGRKFEFAHDWRIVPQAQITYSHARFEPFVDSAGTSVDPDDAQSLEARIGVAVGRERVWEADDGTTRRLEVEAGLHLHQELAGRTRVNVSGTPLYNEEDDAAAEITLGATYNWNDEQNSVYGEVGIQTGLRNFGTTRRIAGTVGYRRKWD